MRLGGARAREHGLAAQGRGRGIEIKAPTFTEIEFEDDGEAELFFVPIRTGTFPWRCRGMESRGMAGTFVVK